MISSSPGEGNRVVARFVLWDHATSKRRLVNSNVTVDCPTHHMLSKWN